MLPAIIPNPLPNQEIPHGRHHRNGIRQEARTARVLSSHNFNVSLKVEVASLEDIHAEVERVYRILQTSVDEQIVNPGFVPGHERPAASNAPRAPTPGTARTGSGS
jgi:hypothetical protein